MKGIYLNGGFIVKYILIVLVFIMSVVPVFAYENYSNYSVVGSDRNSTGYVQQVGSSYYGSNGVTYTPQGNGRIYSNTGATYETQGNVIQQVNGKRYVKMGSVIYEE